MKNEAAAALGRMGKGIPKRITDEERARRSARMHALNARRVEVKFEPEVEFAPAIDNKTNVGDVKG